MSHPFSDNINHSFVSSNDPGVVLNNSRSNNPEIFSTNQSKIFIQYFIGPVIGHLGHVTTYDNKKI